MSFRVTLPCTRAQGEAVGALDEVPDLGDDAAALVADEPDPDRPDDWLIHAYFEQPPSEAALDAIALLGTGPPKVEELGEANWVTMSQAGIRPLRAGRFNVHTPTHPPTVGVINFEIDAGLAFGTGQHATTAGCLEALDRIEVGGARFSNVADIGTGTGLLAFAALALWPDATAIATDIDAVAVAVARDNAAINRIALGHGPGELLLAVADGMDSALLAARTPFDLIVANILAGPLIELAPDFAAALAPGGTIILAGLLASQAQSVIAAFAELGLTNAVRAGREWPIIVIRAG